MQIKMLSLNNNYNVNRMIIPIITNYNTIVSVHVYFVQNHLIMNINDLLLMIIL